jgi:hypothetical protein
MAHDLLVFVGQVCGATAPLNGKTTGPKIALRYNLWAVDNRSRGSIDLRFAS